jgi:hypothetical protein
MEQINHIVPATGYKFDASSKIIRFSDAYAGLELSHIGVITNLVSGITIYRFSDSTKTATLEGLTLTLTYNTVAMADTDALQILIKRFVPAPQKETCLQEILLELKKIRTHLSLISGNNVTEADILN